MREKEIERERADRKGKEKLMLTLTEKTSLHRAGIHKDDIRKRYRQRTFERGKESNKSREGKREER